MKKKQVVSLTEQERHKLTKILSNGNAPAKKHKICKALLKMDPTTEGGGGSDKKIGEAVGFSHATVSRLRKKFVEGKLEKVFEKKFTPRLSRRKIQGAEEAKLIALCCGAPPEGYARWSLRLLSNKVVELGFLESIDHTTIGRALKKTNLSLGKKKNGASPQK